MDKEIIYLNRRIYTLEFKHQVCRDHIENGFRLRDLVIKYKLSTHSIIYDWLRQLGYIEPMRKHVAKVTYIGLENYTELSRQTITPKTIEFISNTADQAEIARLKKALEDAKLQAEGYKRMIEIAEDELKISIKKKYSTK